MTTDATQDIDPVDEISQAQAEIDQEQDAPTSDAPSVSGITLDEVRQLMVEQLAPIQNEVRGLQGNKDRSWDAIRKEMSDRVDSKIEEIQSNFGRQAWLNTLDEREKELVTPLLNEIDRSQTQPGGDVAETTVQQPDTQTQVSQVEQWVRSQGVDPNDPLIRPTLDLALYSEADPNLKAQHLGAAIAAAKASKGTPAAQTSEQTTTTTTEQPRGNPPPVEDASRAGSAQVRTADQVRDAMITGQISLSEGKEKLNRMGLRG